MTYLLLPEYYQYMKINGHITAQFHCLLFRPTCWWLYKTLVHTYRDLPSRSLVGLTLLCELKVVFSFRQITFRQIPLRRISALGLGIRQNGV